MSSVATYTNTPNKEISSGEGQRKTGMCGKSQSNHFFGGIDMNFRFK
jgi:hypothetical protein